MSHFVLNQYSAFYSYVSFSGFLIRRKPFSVEATSLAVGATAAELHPVFFHEITFSCCSAAADKNWACSLSWKKGLSGIKDKTLSYNNLSLGAPSSHYLHSSQVQVHKTTFISKGKKQILGS